MFDLFQHIFTHYHWSNLVPSTVVVLLALIYWKWLKPRWPQVRNIVGAIALIALLRPPLTDNPWVYQYVYGEHVTHEDAGWFVDSWFGLRSYKFYYDPGPTKFLALGSSQTAAIYGPHENPDLRVLNYAGMQPAEFPFLKSLIDRYEAENILVYISMFDMGRPVYVEKLPILPGSLSRLPQAWRLYQKYDPEHPLAILRCATAWTLLEYENHEMFKAFRNGFLGAPAAFKQFEEFDPPPKIIPEKNLDAEKKRRAQSSNFDVHLSGLTDLIKDHPDSRIIIVEGHYHPEDFHNQDAMNQRVQKLLMKVADSYPNAYFIPHKQFDAFNADDYSDRVHVRNKAGSRFAGQLLKYLSETFPDP